MPLTGEGHRSPRDAIRAWLSKADNGSEDKPKGRDNTHNIREAITQDGEVSHHRARRASPKHTAANLAERLRLQAPFRTLASVEHSEDCHDHSKGHQRKRRRRSASESSYLKPAVAAPTDQRTADSIKWSRRYDTKGGYRNSDSDVLNDNDSISSSSSVEISKKPAKTYERRPRRKTREDRYEPKVSKKNEGKSQKDGKRSSKRKRMHKSGARLVYDHDAKNVSKNRLTLRPAQSLGLFKKGRASSPIRRGLPDLAFSEMNFLSNRRDKSEELSKPADGKKRREKAKAADVEEEISRFFTSRKQFLTETDSNPRQKQLPGVADSSYSAHEHRKRTLPKESAQRQSSYPPVGLLDKPFLGFGNRGVRPVSPLEPRGPLSKSALSVAPSEIGQAISGQSSTYFTWSRSGIRSESPHRKSVKDTAPSLGSPGVSASLNRAMPSIEVGQLGQVGLHTMRSPDKQPELSHTQPHGYRSSLVEGLDRLHPSNGSQSLQSSLALDAQTPKKAVKPWNNGEKPVKLIGDDRDEPSQRLVEIEDTATKTPIQDNKPITGHSDGTLSHSNQPEDRLQSLSSLLRDCEATLSKLGSTECDPSTLPQGNELGQSQSGSVTARNNQQSRPGRAVTDFDAEESQRFNDGLRTSKPRCPNKSTGKESYPISMGNEGFRRDQKRLSRAQLSADQFAPPAHQTDEVHPQSQVSRYGVTASFQKSDDLEDYEQHNVGDLADLLGCNPQLQSPTAYPSAEPRQYSRNSYLFEARGEDCSTGEVGSLRHTTRFDNWDPRNIPHDLDNSQLENIYEDFPTSFVDFQGLEIAPERLKDHYCVDSFSGREIDNVNTYSEVDVDRLGDAYPRLSVSDHREDHSLWADEIAEGSPVTVVQDNVLGEDLLGTCDRNAGRRESRLAQNMELDEMPMASFWRPHRLY